MVAVWHKLCARPCIMAAQTPCAWTEGQGRQLHNMHMLIEAEECHMLRPKECGLSCAAGRWIELFNSYCSVAHVHTCDGVQPSTEAEGHKLYLLLCL